MPNELFRNRAITLIKTAICQFNEVAGIHHPGLKGAIREICAKEIFAPFLPEDYKIKKCGKIVDCWGKQSSEIDLVIYSKKKIPPIIYGEEEFIFPSESVFYAIEIKSKITAPEIESAHLKAKDLINNIGYLSGIHTPDNKAVQHRVGKIIPVLFAFSSDLKEGGKSEIDRYMEIIGPGNLAYVCAICVAGRGYWFQTDEGWLFYPHTDDYDEIICFLSGIINSLHKLNETRGYPRLGCYLMNDSPPLKVA